MAKLAIRGHKTRDKEVIEILEMLGGNNRYNYVADSDYFCFYINNFIDNVTKTISYDWVYNFNGKDVTLEEFLKKFPYKVGDKIIDIKTNKIVEIYKAHWSESNNCTYYDIKLPNGTCCVRSYKFLKPYKEKETMESKSNLLQQLKEYFDRTPREVIEKEWHEYDKYNEIGPSVKEYLEYINSIRQLQYPKNYEECCEMLGKTKAYQSVSGYKTELLEDFQKLLICRDAYWKIAGDWKPEFRFGKKKYCIMTKDNKVINATVEETNRILVFPNEKIRDFFYENFKNLIEVCKELL